MTAPDAFGLAARLLIRDGPDSWQQILRDHVADASGRCAGCPPGLTGRPRFPCTLRRIGEIADDTHTE